MVLSLTPYDFPALKCGSKCSSEDQLRDVCCHLANTTELQFSLLLFKVAYVFVVGRTGDG